jgi:shikimate kinase / 3-dehydroquinate synthase
MRDLILTGFMGTGKTTIGKILADRYCLEFVDTDNEIERRAGYSISEFKKRGEWPKFRQLESEVLRDLATEGQGRVIATGGGALVDQRNRDHLSADQQVICLTCDRELLIKRLLADQQNRPSISGLDEPQVRAEVERLMTERQSEYELFERVDTSNRTDVDIARELGERFAMAGSELRFDSGRSTRMMFTWPGNGSIARLLQKNGMTGAVTFVTDSTVMKDVFQPKISPSKYGHPLEPFRWGSAVFPPGEEYKTLETAGYIYRTCKGQLADRTSSIVGVGGGVVCDLAGFAAATYMRGIRLVLIPTTLLAQADAAIGGKTAVDFEGVKNLIGSFYPADLVIVCPELLATLSDAQLADGIAEIVKSAAIKSESLLAHVEALNSPRDILDKPFIVRKCAELKARVVETDPYERTGERAILNFGHTVGHGIEAASEYGLSHGQSISIGMLAETWLAERNGIAPAGLRDRLAGILTRFDLPVSAPDLDPDTVFNRMLQDKKRLGNKIRFALPTGIGQGALFEVTEHDARAAVAVALGGAD